MTPTQLHRKVVYMKRILILGGGVYQAPLIRRAVEKGYWVAVASMKKDDPGMGKTDESWEVDITDSEEILKLVREHNIAGVTSTGTEFSIPTIAYLHENSGLPGISLETAKISTNKILAQNRYAEKGVPIARFKRVRTLVEAMTAAGEIGFPVVVKAPDSSGSRGITVVFEPSQVDAALATAMRISGKGEVLVEEQLTGVEFGAQAVVLNGEVEYCLCHNDTVTPPPITVPIGHSLPFALTDEIRSETQRVCSAAVKALNIKDAICNVDLIATSSGVRLFEIGARIGATGLPEIVNLHHGINLYDVALELAMGECPDIEPSFGPAAASLLIKAPCTGELVRCNIPEEVAQMEGVVEVNFDYPVGADVSEFVTGPDRIGDILVTADDAVSAERLAEQVTAMLEIEVEPA